MKESILVTTEYLTQKEREWSAFLERAEKLFLESCEGTKELEKVFYGKPVMELKKRILAQREAGETAFAMLMNHIGKLKEIAFSYETAERSNRDFFKKN